MQACSHVFSFWCSVWNDLIRCLWVTLAGGEFWLALLCGLVCKYGTKLSRSKSQHSMHGLILDSSHFNFR